MGSCHTTSDATTLEKLLDEEMRKSKKADEQIKKILLLGNGGSGKSTLCKQLRLIHDDGYHEQFRRECITYIHQQLVDDMKLAIDVYIKYKHRKAQQEAKRNAPGDSVRYSMDYRDDDLWMFDQLDLQGLVVEDVKSADMVREYYYDKQAQTLGPDICAAIKSLRDDPAIQRIWDCRNLTHLQTSTKYLWEKLESIADPNYLPSEQDILLYRRRTCSYDLTILFGEI